MPEALNQRYGEPFLDEVRRGGPTMVRLGAGLGTVSFATMWVVDPLLVGGDYRRLHAPVHLVGGRHSPGCARAVLAALSAQLPHSELVTLSAGHMAPVTHGWLVNPVLETFIRGVDGDDALQPVRALRA